MATLYTKLYASWWEDKRRAANLTDVLHHLKTDAETTLYEWLTNTWNDWQWETCWLIVAHWYALSLPYLDSLKLEICFGCWHWESESKYNIGKPSQPNQGSWRPICPTVLLRWVGVGGAVYEQFQFNSWGSVPRTPRLNVTVDEDWSIAIERRRESPEP